MSIATEIEATIKSNHRVVFITDADDLLAAWQFQRRSSKKRSMNLNMVSTEWRYSAPPEDKSAMMPVHVSFSRKGGRAVSTVKPARQYSTIDCHGHGRRLDLSVPDLNTLDAVGFAKRNVAPYVSPILDAGTLVLVCKDLGISGKAIPKVINGRQYIAFSGYSGLRTHFPGTLYSAKNRRIIKMAIGALGIKNKVKTGGMITFCISVPLTILECFMQDHDTLPTLVGSVASELIKIGIGVIMGAIAGIAAGGFTTVAGVPLLTAIIISVALGAGLSVLDERYKLTVKLTAALENSSNQLSQKLENETYRAQRTMYQGIKGVLRSNGLRGPLQY